MEGRRDRVSEWRRNTWKVETKGRTVDLWNDLSCLPDLPALRRLVSRLPEQRTDVFWSGMDGFM